MMCDLKTIDNKDSMNLQPPIEETMNVDAPSTEKQPQDEHVLKGIVEKLKVLKEGGKNLQTEKVDDMSDASSSGEDEDDDDADDDSEGPLKDNVKESSKDTEGSLQIPQRYTKSGRKRSIPFPVRVS
jgi:hypothetical protein